MKYINLILPYPPSANLYWRTTRQGKTYISGQATAYKEEVKLKTAKKGYLTGDLIFNVNFYRPRKTGDLDNRLKVLIDALKGSVFEDDKQIVEIHAYRFDDKIMPRAEILIQEKV